MKRRLTALLLALCLCLSLAGLPAALAAGQAQPQDSGLSALPKLTPQEITALLADNPLGFAGEAMATLPSTTAPYTAGTVSDAALSTALARFNALRRLAGLRPVTLDSTLTDQAQHAAVLLAATGELTHTPQNPGDMDPSFFRTAATAAASSNIYQGTNATLPQAVEAFFDDSDAGNLPMLGHRRWMLNPSMGKTGFGFSPSDHAYSGLAYNFAACWAFDRSGSDGGYRFIAWPASGSFPNTLFASHEAWSVTLNPTEYLQPALGDLTVTLQCPNGETQTLSGGLAYAPADSGPYLNVNTQPYGVANAIIFRPDVTGSYQGTYTVTIDGLKTSARQATSLTYTVDFFDPAATPSSPTPTPVPSPQPTPSLPAPSPSATPVPTPEPTATPTVPAPDPAPSSFTDVSADAWYASAVAFATQKGLFNGVGGGRFDPEGPMTRAMVMTVLARLDGEDTTPQYLETWDIRGRRWAVTNRISDGLNSEGAITLEQLATMLYRYAQLRYSAAPAHNYHLPAMPDGSSVSSWAADAANWAVDRGVLIGDENRNLNPQRTATRAQVAILLQRFLTKVAAN